MSRDEAVFRKVRLGLKELVTDAAFLLSVYLEGLWGVRNLRRLVCRRHMVSDVD